MTTADVQRMRDELFFEGPDKVRRITRYWLLLPLSAVIAAAGVVSDSTATVIGAMIVAPLMTPILGLVLSAVLADGSNLRRSFLLLVSGACAVVAVGFIAGFFVPYPVVAATSSQVAARISPRLVDLVAALATGAVGSVALARSDISDTLPGVAIAISLVPPLAVTGLTLEANAFHQSLGSLLLFITNVVAILASGIVVMALFRVRAASGLPSRPVLGHVRTSVVIGLLLAVVILPLWVNSQHFEKTNIEVTGVQAVTDRWANAAGWSVLGVTSKGETILVDATGPFPKPNLSSLRHDLRAAGLGRVVVRVQFLTGRYVPVS
jgi:uncharacterized hydrophobic protein (TIGR00271 family)